MLDGGGEGMMKQLKQGNSFPRTYVGYIMIAEEVF